MKNNLILLGIAILFVGCQSKGASWPISLRPSMPTPAPQPTQNLPPENPSNQISNLNCALKFDRTANLKQIALQAALIYQKCKLSEDQVMALMDTDSNQNSGQNSNPN